jgi:hypothetical protein
VAIESAKVIESDHEWVAAPDLLKMLNDPLRAELQRNDLVRGFTCWLQVLSPTVH